MQRAVHWFFCAFVVLAGIAPAAARQSSPTPAMWVIEGGPGTVEILGSVHLLKPGTKWYDGAVKSALERSDDLVLETVLDAAAYKKIQEITVARGLYPEGQSLKANVPPAVYQHTVEAAQKMGIQEPVIQRFRPWYASVVLASGAVQSMGFDSKSGVEQTLTEEAKLRGLKVSGLETAEEQIMVLAGTDPSVQLSMLEDTMRQNDDVKQTLDKLTGAWTHGDLKTLERLLVDEVKTNQALYDLVIVKRNDNWVPKIRALMAKPGHHLLVVGAAHLVGPDSVILKLEKAGVKVRRQ
ncbi:TraB/GumN family protein [Govanella unica]|uniref:TraB/GumN family protein n=1 Tax=Govanella unica TaxID=2975056 RepID=A0A9X3TWF9_9PROT|nr:TraB/GumN family protein [Govania unica]MDA5192974.1 TraB/GumN family protein [Govania unica]